MGTGPLVLLVRHAHTTASDTWLSGRTPGIHLSDRGREELLRLRTQLMDMTLNAVYSSPLIRARETAGALATDHHLEFDVEDDLNEMDFGQWTGLAFDALQSDPRWREFNARRASAHVPDGERAGEVQRRIVMLLSRLAARHRSGTIALVTHAEIIRSAILWFSGRSLDDFHQCAIDTASVSGLHMASTPRVVFVNSTDRSSLHVADQLDPVSPASYPRSHPY
jgi:broad specificity phosphatase PhoE